MRWAFGSSTLVKETFEPRDVVANTVFMIACENGMGRALSGTGGTRSSVVCSPTCCRSLRSSLLALRCPLVTLLLLLGGHTSYPRFAVW